MPEPIQVVQALVTPVAKDLMPSSGLCRHCTNERVLLCVEGEGRGRRRKGPGIRVGAGRKRERERIVTPST